MKDGTIDAMFWSGGLPTGGITDLFISQRETSSSSTYSTLQKLQEINSIYETPRHPGRRPTRRRLTCRRSWCRICFWSKTIWTATSPAC